METAQQKIPVPALVLGLGGLIPFFGAAVLVWWQHDSSASQLATKALGAYGAVILSFLGGVRWGNVLSDDASLRRWMPLCLSVVPSLLAWPALLLAAVPQLALLCTGFTLQYALDVSAARRGEIPQWYGRLRLILTSGAIVSLLVGMLGSYGLA